MSRSEPSAGDAYRTLFHPFSDGTLAAPQKDARVLLLGAVAGLALPDGFSAAGLACAAGFRPDVLSLERAGFAVSPEAAGDGYAAVLVLAGRHRGLNELRVAEALERASPGALVVVAGGKTDGIASLRRRIAGLAAIDGSAAKHHGVAFWLRRPADPGPAVAALRAANPPVAVEGFVTAPGMFSHGRIDPASRLLAAQLPDDVTGPAADFCAGWGYLAAALAARNPGLAAIDLYEADHAALEAARDNLARLAPAVRAGFFWRDLVAEPAGTAYDAIVMNPPFHQGRAAEPQLGQALIRAAAAALRPGGRLFLVANRELPYEAVLDAAFRDWRETDSDGRFKAIEARR